MTRIVFDPFHPEVDESVFALGTTDWKDFYGDIGRSFLLGCWSHWVKSAHTRWFVYANHAGNVVTWHLHTGIFVYVMNVPIIVGRSTFGLEFVATRITKDSIVALRYNIYHVAGILRVGKGGYGERSFWRIYGEHGDAHRGSTSVLGYSS